jgi:uncharacterized protein (TIGR00661 family)
MKKKFVFTVQGEGRGHLTQAIATYEMLTAQGHDVAAVLVGSSNRRELPAFVRERIKCPVMLFPSPNFVTDKDNKSIQLGKTVWKTLIQWKSYRRSMRLLRTTIEDLQPDLLLNFYEPLVGICSRFKRLPVKTVSIAHQFLYLHPGFEFPEDSPAKDKWAIRHYTRLTATGADALLALSFYPMDRPVYKKIRVCPPLLRKEVARQELFDGEHILVYLLNSGYMKEVINWHKNHPQVQVHCFTDSATVKGKWQYHENLYFHSLDDQKFLRFMANAKGLVTTAGFESVCEAMFMGKPVLMVPVQGHFEQWCNARDAHKAGAGIYADSFQLNALLEYIPRYRSTAKAFGFWQAETEEILLNTFAEVLKEPFQKNEAPVVPLPHLLPGQQFSHS